FASETASFAAPSASRTLRSRRRSSFGPARPLGSKSLTSAATRTGESPGSKALIQPIPLSPSTAARQVSGAVFPTGVIAPSPVTTTRRTGGSLVATLAGLRALADDQVHLGAVCERRARPRPLAEHAALLLLRGDAARDLADSAVGFRDRRPGLGDRLAEHLRDNAVETRWWWWWRRSRVDRPAAGGRGRIGVAGRIGRLDGEGVGAVRKTGVRLRRAASGQGHPVERAR